MFVQLLLLQLLFGIRRMILNFSSSNIKCQNLVFYFNYTESTNDRQTDNYEEKKIIINKNIEKQNSFSCVSKNGNAIFISKQKSSFAAP